MFFKKPKSPKKAEQIAGYIVSGLLYLIERTIGWINRKILNSILNHFGVEMNNIPPNRRQLIRFWNTLETILIVMAFICFLADAYWGLTASLIIISIIFYLMYKEISRYQVPVE